MYLDENALSPGPSPHVGLRMPHNGSHALVSVYVAQDFTPCPHLLGDDTASVNCHLSLSHHPFCGHHGTPSGGLGNSLDPTP